MHFQANEIRTFILNAAVYVFKFCLPDPYYSHFVRYILFLRLLTQAKISKQDISLAAELINYFVIKYKALYSKYHLTYNLHSHLHLPLRVLFFGPLHMISRFPFEGFFKICHGLFNGTRSIAEQITRNLAITEQLSFIRHFTNFKFTDNPGIEKLSKLLHKKSNSTINEETSLVNSKTVNLDDLCESEKILIGVKFNGSESILASEKLFPKLNCLNFLRYNLEIKNKRKLLSKNFY